MKKLVVALAVGTLAIGLVVIQLWSEQRAVREQTVLLSDRIADLQSARLAAALKPSVPVSDITASGAAAAAARETYVKELRAAMAKSEAHANAMRREMMPERYPDLGKQLGLTPAQLDGLFDLLANQQATSMADMRTRADAPPDAAALEELTRRSRERKQANEAEQAAMLGGKYAKWQEYQKTSQVRQQVVQFQSALGPNAMSEAQSSSLIAAIAAAQVRNQESRRSAPRLQNLEDLRRAAEEENTRLVDAAAAHLNPGQLEVYRSFLKREQSTMNAMSEMMKSPPGVSRPNR